MAIETGTTIENFQIAWPLSGDPVSEGDDHIRLIKSILRAQFPGVGGNGFASPITAIEDEINFLSGVTSNVQTQLDALKANLNAPAGTAIPFYNTIPPTGWIANPSINDSMLRVVSANGGSSGGTDSPIAISLAHTHTTGSHALTISEMPAHSHTFGIDVRRINTANEGDALTPDNVATIRTDSYTTSSQGANAAHTHGATGSALADFAPKYSNVVIGVKQ